MRRAFRTATPGEQRSAGAATIGYALLLAGYLGPGVALAQLSSDQVPRSRTIPAQDAIKAEVETSRFRLGPIRLIPQFRISEAGYDSNVFGTSDPCPPLTGCDQPKTSDWLATVSAGARLILPVGSKIYLRADAVPRYTWYKDLSDRRGFGGLYQGSVFAFFNRMSVEVSGYQQESLAYLTSETEVRAVQTVRDGTVKLELDLARRLSLFAVAEYQTLRAVQTDERVAVPVNLRLYDRDGGAARAGIRYRISPQWDISASVEATRTEFAVSREERDNESVAYLGGIHYDRPRFFANLSAAYREGRPVGGSSFPKYRTANGSYFASYFLTRRLELQVFGSRALVYALLTSQNPFYYETQNGGSLNLEVHRRVLLRAFGLYGTNDYPQKELLGEELVDRLDKYTTLGGGFSAILTGKLVLTALVNRTDHDSIFPGGQRSVLRFFTGLSFEGEFSR